MVYVAEIASVAIVWRMLDDINQYGVVQIMKRIPVADEIEYTIRAYVNKVRSKKRLSRRANVGR